MLSQRYKDNLPLRPAKFSFLPSLFSLLLFLSPLSTFLISFLSCEGGVELFPHGRSHCTLTRNSQRTVPTRKRRYVGCWTGECRPRNGWPHALPCLLSYQWRIFVTSTRIFNFCSILIVCPFRKMLPNKSLNKKLFQIRHRTYD